MARRSRGEQRRATIKDVARAAKVSLGTVSRVVNQHPAVDPGTRRRVTRVMADLGYAPNAVAQSMRTNVTRTVGFIVPDISNPNWSCILRAASDVLQRKGYTTVVGSTGGERTAELDTLSAFTRRRTDALILALDTVDTVALRRTLEPLDVPVVMLERELGDGWDAVLTDHAGGAYAATRHLLGLGHRRIALITALPSVRPGGQRVHGYTRAFAEAGVAPTADLLRCGSFDPDFAFRETSTLLTRRDAPTAVIAGGIQLLAGVLRAAALHGFAIPANLSVVSCGDTDLAQLANPPVTVARWDVKALGVAVAEAVLRRLDGTADATPFRLLLESELVLRGSCAPPARVPRRRAGRSVETFH